MGYALFSSRGSSQCRLTNAASIYTAELYAIHDAIEYSATHAAEYETITIHSDSRSAIQALSSPSQQYPLIQQIQNTIIMSTKSFTLCWVPSHVGVEGNERADELAKTSIHLPITPLSIPRSDYINLLKLHVRSTWQSSWHRIQDNKLREILPTIASCYEDPHSQQWSIKLNRLKIGHSALTHEYLLKRDHCPFCQDCLVPLTVKWVGHCIHISIE